MKADSKIVAYIDGANLHKGVSALGWELDYSRFRTWLTHRFGVGKAYVFIGYISRDRDLYTYLNDSGFSLVFKEVIFDTNGRAKGNCDADLIVRTLQDIYEDQTERAIIVTSDGDYAPLIRLLMQKKKMSHVVSPTPRERCSVLLRKTNVPLLYLIDKQILVSKIKRPPEGNASQTGSFL